MFDQIEKLKSEYTDKYVVVDSSIPELRRFDGHVGQVKTINMNGRALVQFDCWNNIGWYDIELDCLKVVPKPDPAAAEAKAKDAKKDVPRPVKKVADGSAPTTGEKKLSPLELARMQGPAKGAAGGAKKSTADILAAARAGKGAAAGSAPAAAKPAGKMSTADILAAARAKKAPEAAPAAEAPAEEPAEAATTTVDKPATKPAGGKTSLPAGQRPTVAQILAWCRENDAK